jgi:hypothetical protein
MIHDRFTSQMINAIKFAILDVEPIHSADTFANIPKSALR